MKSYQGMVCLLPLLASMAAFAGQAPQAGAAQPDMKAVRVDFVPGEKTLFYDDFTDMAADAPPPHWRVRGGTAELRMGGGARQLTFAATSMTAVPNLRGVPKNFTVEAALKFDNPGGNGARAIWRFLTKAGSQALMAKIEVQKLSDEGKNSWVEVVTGDPTENPERIAQVRTGIDWSQPCQFALWVQDGRIRVYSNGARLADVNQIKLEEIASVELMVDLDEEPGTAVGLRTVRIAESAPDLSKTIVSSGRYVTHGILFDTDSDRIKPESAAVIKQIAQAFETNPNLKMLIEGHTDATGSAQRNLELSKQRAEAVKAVLSAQFGIGAERLTTAGLGSSKPIETNDTPAGRAQNRRVEFVRQ